MAKKKQPDPNTEPKSKRQTFHLSIDVIEKLQAVAYWERLTMKEVLEDAVIEHINRLEKKRGKPFEPIPEGRKVRQGRPPKW